MLELSHVDLTDQERADVERTLTKMPDKALHDHESLWQLVDQIWDEYNCDNKTLDWDRIGAFYSDPVWLVNGLFIEQDPVSMKHRQAIANWVSSRDFKNIVDYGGGFGTLARLIALNNPAANIEVFEPHPTEVSKKRLKRYPNVTMIEELRVNYDALLCTDVLEHVEDPLKDFAMMVESLNDGGHIVIANCFFPVVKCHLPKNFHFRYTFNAFAKLMELDFCGNLEGSHAVIFRKKQSKIINWRLIRFLEFMSSAAFPILENLSRLLRYLKKLFKK